MAGDMPDRLEWIIENFQGKVKTITEFGTYQGCSTIAWLACCPERLTCIDIKTEFDYLNEYIDASRETNTLFEYKTGNSLLVDIEPTDLLFIDTVHTKEHVYQELTKHSSKILKYLVLHDVNPSKWTTLDGVNRWLREQPANSWTVYYHDNVNDGFAVLKRA